MNEFLKHLRSSGKDRPHQPTQQHRGQQYDPHFQDRRTGNERRSAMSQQRQMADSGEMVEILDRISYFLEKLTDYQAKIVDSNQRLAEAEERRNIIFESIEAHLGEFMASVTEGGIQLEKAEDSIPEIPIPENLDKKIEERIAERQAGLVDRGMIVQMVKKMRKQGSTYEQIAKFLDEENIPTFSKKGKWHAQTIHRLCRGV